MLFKSKPAYSGAWLSQLEVVAANHFIIMMKVMVWYCVHGSTNNCHVWFSSFFFCLSWFLPGTDMMVTPLCEFSLESAWRIGNCNLLPARHEILLHCHPRSAHLNFGNFFQIRKFSCSATFTMFVVTIEGTWEHLCQFPSTLWLNMNILKLTCLWP